MQLIDQKLHPVTHSNLMMLHDNIWGDLNVETKAPEEIYVFFHWGKLEGSDKEGESCWVRFMKEGKPFTFWLTKKMTDALVKGKFKLDSNAVLNSLRGIKRPRLEVPKEWLSPAAEHPHDELLQEDYRNLDSAVEEMRTKVSKTLADIKNTSHRLLALTACRDHDLFMTFTMDPEDRTIFRLRYDKVFPKLPEHDLVIGVSEEFGLVHNENPTYNAVVDQLKMREALINKQISNARKKYQFKGLALELFNKEVVATLLAGINFSGRVFSYDGEHGKALLDEVANDILTKMVKAREGGRNLGLDISSWFVWEYFEDNSEPKRVVEEDLDFTKTIVEGYLDSFVSLLSTRLIEASFTDVVKPYQHRVKADLSDGHAIGSMRRTG